MSTEVEDNTWFRHFMRISAMEVQSLCVCWGQLLARCLVQSEMQFKFGRCKAYVSSLLMAILRFRAINTAVCSMRSAHQRV